MFSQIILSLIGSALIGGMCFGLTVIPICKVFFPEAYPKTGISIKKVFYWAFNYGMAGGALLLSALVARHLPLP